MHSPEALKCINHNSMSRSIPSYACKSRRNCLIFIMDLASMMIPGAATSYHPSYPPCMILDQSLKTFWVSTGFPKHELLFTFKQSTAFGKIGLVLSKIAKLEIWIGKQELPLDFELLHAFGETSLFIFRINTRL